MNDTNFSQNTVSSIRQKVSVQELINCGIFTA